jgi:hypothetical protein
VHFEIKRLGVFGRIVAVVISLLVFSAVFFASFAVFVGVILFALFAVLAALIMPGTPIRRKPHIIEGEPDTSDDVSDIARRKDS